MDEAQRLTLPAPGAMLRHLGGRADRRKVRLFAAACWRRRCRDMTSFGQVRRVIRLAEQIADGERRVRRRYRGWVLLRADIYAMAVDTIETVGDIRGRGNVPPAEPAALLRDVFGNPFRPAPFSPAWRTDTAVALARQMYESREFGAMPILADALQDAGCDDPEALGHLRRGTDHGCRAPGCWALDRLLTEEPRDSGGEPVAEREASGGRPRGRRWWRLWG